jgi:lipopolysaccharide transport system permease protein
MIVFTLIFGQLAKIGSDGVPYAIFSYTAVVPWTFFSRSLMDATGSLTKNSAMVTKIYFPRVILPLTSVLGKLVDFGIALILVGALMAWFHMIPTYWAFMLPVFVLIMMMTAAGMGMWLTAMAVQFRDVQYASTFVIQLMMYAAPVVYPASLVPDNLRLVYGINPLAGVIEGFRSALLGTNPMPWDLITSGSISAVVIMITGAVYFRRMERYFADVV